MSWNSRGFESTEAGTRSAADDRVPWSLQGLTALLGGLAVIAFAVVEADGPFQKQDAVCLILWLSVMACGGAGMRRLARRWTTPPSVSPLLVLLAVSPLAWELLSRGLLGSGRPFEVLTMSVLRNLVVGLAVLGPWRRFHSLCLSLSLFLILFGVVTSQDAATRVLAGFFAVGATAWLAATHWHDVRQRLAGQQTMHSPRRLLVLGVAIAAGVLGCLRWSGGDRVIRSTFEGWLASSGGTGQRDPFSQGGVGDGEMLVAGSERVQSFAPIENAPFVSDDQPSLYDVFDDTYEEPAKPIRNQDRAVGLPPEQVARIKEHLHAKTEKANREFSTLRRSPSESPRRPVESIASDALFYVAGRVPLHLRLQPYDLFDGIDWHPEPEPASRPPLAMTVAGDKPWLDLPDRGPLRRYLAAPESHAIKVVRLGTNIVPAPLYAHGVHIDQVAQADMFRWGPDGLVRMDRQELPRLVPIHLLSRSIDTAHIGDEFSAAYSAVGTVYRTIPAEADESRMRGLAQSWTAGVPRGWSQIEAIQIRLRGEYVLDRDARPDPSAESPVVDFLFRARRGPDYQFATAAALLLRSLGYSTRVVSGFYADPLKCDAASRHTPVFASDVHFWTEVNVAGGDWLPVEPSPGYSVLAPPLSWWQRISEILRHCADLALNHAALVCGLTAAGLLALSQRRWILDALDTLRWRWSRRHGDRRHLLATLRLLERRSARSGEPRPTGMTTDRWLTRLASADSPLTATDSRNLRRWIDEAIYARDPKPAPRETVLETSRRIERALSMSWFRRHRSRPAGNRRLAP